MNTQASITHRAGQGVQPQLMDERGLRQYIFGESSSDIVPYVVQLNRIREARDANSGNQEVLKVLDKISNEVTYANAITMLPTSLYLP